MPADGGIRFGNYVLLRRIARGGMAEVFLAQQRGLEGFDRRVAVKRILPHLVDSPDFVKMFLGEAKLAAQLTHPNIVHIYDFGKVDHDYFIAMEYVEGVHAGELFKQGEKQGERERMSPALVARIGADAAAALHYAHELRAANGKPLGLVHRDVSPANLMVSFDGVVKLCDFGIAKAAALSDQRTNPGQVKGKYAYMSPEQTVAGQLDGRSDVFSLAIVLWELLAGKTIVSRGDAVAAMRAIRDGKIQPIAEAVPGLPPQLAAAITWALAKRREDRATSADLATALEAYIKSAPELATPMQLGAWVRARFPRESMTGPQQVLTGAGPSTMAGPGTIGAGTSGAGTSGAGIVGAGTSGAGIVGAGTSGAGIVLSDTGTRIVAVAPGAAHAEARGGAMGRARTQSSAPRSPAGLAPVSVAQDPPKQPEPDEGPDETSETAIVSNDPEAGVETILVEGRGYEAANRPTLLAGQMPRLAGSGNATMIEDPSLRGAIATTSRDDSPVATRDTLRDPSGVAAALRSGPQPLPFTPGQTSGPHALASGPHALASGPYPRPSPAAMRTEATAGMRKRAQRRLALLGGLAAIATASFLVSLVVCSPRRQASAPAPSRPDAPRPDAPRADAPRADAPVPTDAAIAIAEPDARPPAVPVDAALRLQLYKVDTRPTGGTVRIGDQKRAAPAEFMLEPGKYTVTAELEGWQPETRPIELVDGADLVQEIPFTRRLHVVRSPQTGTLTVRTTPYSDVYIGTRKLGQAPFADKEVPAGTHWLIFKNPLHPTVRKQVTIVAGKLTKLPPFNLPPP